MRAALLAVALVVAGCGSPKPAAPPPSSQSTLLGKPAPEFRRPAMDGADVKIANAKGKVVVVKFFAKYCEPCKRTLPAIEKLHKDHAEIVVIGVAEDEHEAEAKEVVDAYHLSFPVVHDASNVLAARWRVRELPVTYVIDGQGNVAWVGGPEKTESELVAAIESTKP
jgi:cytochrome c biogenesis protein CcmG/thiol:disulfide interchange protein DsbE